MKLGDKLIQSYVLERYFVSTLLRDSSCAEWPYPFFETMVWAWDKETRERGELLQQHDHDRKVLSALMAHLNICVSLARGEEVDA